MPQRWIAHRASRCHQAMPRTHRCAASWCPSWSVRQSHGISISMESLFFPRFLDNPWHNTYCWSARIPYRRANAFHQPYVASSIYKGVSVCTHPFPEICWQLKEVWVDILVCRAVNCNFHIIVCYKQMWFCYLYTTLTSFFYCCSNPNNYRLLVGWNQTRQEPYR